MSAQGGAWYYIWAGRVHGPVTVAEFQALMAEGINPAKVELAREGDERWMTLEEARVAPVPVPGRTGLPPTSSFAARPYPENVMDGLGYWLTLGWEMLMADVWAWVLATLLMMVVSGASLGILAPPLQMGLWLMALRVYDGKPVRPANVFDGLGLFLPAWGLNIILSVIMLAPLTLLGIAGVIAYGSGGKEVVMPVITIGWVIVFLPWFALMYLLSIVCMFCMPIIAERRAGVIESIGMSWRTVRPQFWAYLLVLVVLGMINGAGSQACYVGIFVTTPYMFLCMTALHRDKFPAATGDVLSANNTIGE